ncbi:hypothetical protein Gotur_020204, partial [Gossypium turneri]
MAEPYIEQVEHLDVLTKIGKKRAFPSPGTSLYSCPFLDYLFLIFQH